MRLLRSMLFPALLSLAGCSGFVFFSNDRVLIAVVVNPSLADPINFPGNQVQFFASGSFTIAPSPVSPLDVIWTVDRPAFSSAPDLGHASISPNGVAQCTPGFTGRVQIFATAAANPSLPVSPANDLVGVAQMNCP